MLGYKLASPIHRSLQGFDYEADAILLLDLVGPYIIGTIFFDKVQGSEDLIAVRAEYEDPKLGIIKAVTL